MLAVFLVVFSAITSLLVGGVASATAAACTLGAPSGVVGANVSVSCTDFGASETVKVYWDAKTSGGLMGTFLANGSGAGSGSWAAKDGVSGAHTIYAVGQTSGSEATATFSIVPNMVLASTSGKAGAGVSVTLTGFSAAESVTISYFHDLVTSVAVKTVAVNANGRVLTTVSMPKSVAGAHTLVADGAVATEDPSATYTVVPSVTLAPASGGVDRSVTVNLDGYAAGEAIDVKWASTTLISATADGFGSAATSITVPIVPKGAYTVAGDGATNDASADYTVGPTMDFPQVSYVVHGAINVALSGFGPSASVDIKWFDGNTSGSPSAIVTTTTVAANGTGTVAVTVPDSIKGWHRIEAVSGSDTVAKTAWVKPSISVNPTSGETGDTITAHLDGYAANETVAIVWTHTGSSTSQLATGSVGAKGSGNINFVVPADPTNGDHTVTGDAATDATTTFDLTNPVINLPADCTLQYASGPVGSTLLVACVDYDAGETVTVHLDSAASASLGSFVADGDGEGEVTITVPSTTNGAHTIVTKGATSLETTSDAFTVSPPNCTLTDGNATPGVQGVYGETINFACTGFHEGDLVQVYWDVTTGFPRAAVEAGVGGTASGTFTIPDAVKGVHTVITRSATPGFETTDTITVDPLLSLSATTLTVNQSVSVTLKGFGASEVVALAWVDGATVTPLKSVTVQATGSLGTTFQVPAFPAKATYKVRATGATTGAVKEVTVSVIASMSLAPNMGTPLTSSTATVRGFKANENVTLKWYHTLASSVVLKTGPADANGVFTFVFQVPNSVTGAHKVEAVGGNGSLVSKDFTVSAGISLAKNYGTVGSTVTVTLNGWYANESVKFEWSNNGTWTQVTGSPFLMNGFGRAQFTLTVPETFQGAHTLRATGLTSAIVKTKDFSVNPSLSLAPNSGPVNQLVTVTLKGYAAGETVTLRYFTSPTTSSVVATKVVGSNGSGTVTFYVPTSTVAKHKVTGAGGTSLASAYAYFQVT